MFKNKFEMGLLFSPETDGGAGGAGGETNQASGEQSKESVTPDSAELIKRLDAESKAKQDLLAETKALKEKLRTIENANKEDVKKKAEEERNFEKLLEITVAEKKAIADKLENIERNQQEEQVKLLKSKMLSVFQKELGAELHNPDLANSLVDWSKFITDEKSQYGFNEDGIKQAVNEFRAKHSYLLKSGDVKLPQNSAKPAEQKKSFAERMADNGSFFGKK